MYELLLKWGLDNLGKFAGIKGSHELGVIQEAIKTKNSIIVERYKKCWELYEKLLDLTIEVDSELNNFLDITVETDGTRKSARVFIGKLKTEFHPKFYRKLLKLRSSFDGTNDLISAYTFVFSDIVNIETLEKIIKHKKGAKINSRNYICRLYRGLWTKYCELIAILLRVTSSDLRFWVADTPYVHHADEWAKFDRDSAIKFFTSRSWNGKRFHISLETRRGLDRFWYDLEAHHQDNKRQAEQGASPDRYSAGAPYGR